MLKVSVTKDIELFSPINQRFNEVTILDAMDSFTHNLVQALLALGAPVKVIRSHYISLDDFEGELKSSKYLILSPGPGTPDQAGIFKKAFEKFEGTIPILGVCLGMQTINEIYGGRTIRSNYPVHGKTSEIRHNKKGIFHGINSPTPVARYHSLIVADVSKKLEIQSEYDGIVMAFRNEYNRVAAVQFHPESFMTIYGSLMLENFLEQRI